MTLKIETFDAQRGGHSLFKAVGHPQAARAMSELIGRLSSAGRIGVYDPFGYAETVGQLHDLRGLAIAGSYVQDLGDLGKSVLGRPAQPVTDLRTAEIDALFVTAFDAERVVAQIRHLVPARATLFTLDAIRLPAERLSNARHYLDPLNFATNLAFFRDADGHHTRVVTANYWSGYGARGVKLWQMLFDADGRLLAEWTDALPDAAASITIDSAAVRRRFGLGPFTGQLFLHATGVAGHDVVKYALDTYGDDPRVLSCSHDANDWPADFYAGLPAPAEGERVILWLQNHHPCPIPAGAIGLNLMGDGAIASTTAAVAPYGTAALDVASLLPAARWPQQIEIRAGKHLVRPRYEVVQASGRLLIAHANVERVDLKPDPRIPEIANLMGKGYLLPAPILPIKRWRSLALPTPMATGQDDLPVAALVYDCDGRERARHPFGLLLRQDSVALDLNGLLQHGGADLPVDGWAAEDGGYGHVELVYDFAEGGSADGWLHGLFRYHDRKSGQRADTSFGAHMFNTVLTYRNEPQSYSGRAPGLSTRIFLRLGAHPVDTLCHLIYPASTPWHAHSSTELVLTRADGTAVATRQLAIPCGGSRLWRYSETFDTTERSTAGADAYVLVRDGTCRLFGYHGLIRDGEAFCLDHMFGF
ncbi:MAG: hypothetical protein FJX35_17930 [Alphaproteobacteria bacterium]|nr:hypothetical protein [Alphaproteobacteria bacterium]